MDQVKTFLSANAKNDSTEVCSETAPEVVQETVIPQQKIEKIEAIDRERNIIHHQHRVQPIQHEQVLDTQHQYQSAAEVVREQKGEMLPEHREKLEAQRTMYQNTQTVNPTQTTEAILPVAAQEHVHHHVHETIQPVIQRTTVQPTVVHQTVPIHEKITEAPIVHEATTLPTVTLEEFQAKVGGPHSHKDNTHTHQFYEGAPRVGGGQNATNEKI